MFNIFEKKIIANMKRYSIKKFFTSKFQIDLLFSYFTQGIVILFGFIQVFLINHYIGVYIYGQLMIISSSAGLFSLLLTPRTSEAITRFFTREILKNNFENAKFILIIGFFMDLVVALLTVLLIYMFSNFIAQTFMKDASSSKEVFLYSFIVFFTFLRGTIFGYFQSKKMFFTINTITIFESFNKMIMLIMIVFLFQQSSLYFLILSIVASSLFSFVYALILFIKKYKLEFKNTILIFNQDILKEYYKFNIKTFLSSSLKAGNLNIDNLVLGYFLNAQSVGVYQTIKKILSPIGIMVAPISMLVYPKIIELYELNKKNKLNSLILNISFCILLFSTIYVFAIGFLLDFIFHIMNIEYAKLNYCIYILLSILMLVTSMSWWTRIFSNVVNPNYSLCINIFAMCFQLSFTVYLTYLNEIYGLITSMIIMHIIIYIYYFIKLQKEKYE